MVQILGFEPLQDVAVISANNLYQLRESEITSTFV